MKDNIQEQLDFLSIPEKREFYPRFFKTGRGEYGEGDKFLGVLVPDIRKIAKANQNISLAQIDKLLQSEFHECRLCALLILIEKYNKTKDNGIKIDIFNFYISHTCAINNWDLVDLSVYHIVGNHLLNKDRSILYQWVESDNLWEQRMSIVATLAFIRKKDFNDTLVISEKLIPHKHDLIHKATGWMLREAGKRNIYVLYKFLNKHYKQMPRTMLRYAIEKLNSEERKYYMDRS